MAHQQHHAMPSDSYFKSDLQNHSLASNMPAISEDEVAAELDEPPEFKKQTFVKNRPTLSTIRRQSLLTKALHTDSESHDDDKISPVESHDVDRSRSSTCSTHSGRSTWDFTSDEGHVSHGTLASTPGSPRIKSMTARIPIRPCNSSRNNSSLSRVSDTDSHGLKSPLEESNPVLEAQLGRKRCIQFACAGQPAPVSERTSSPIEPIEKPIEVVTEKKRPCALKFVCPSRAPSDAPVEKIDTSRKVQHSPAPTAKAASPVALRRSHRGSDATIKLDSPKSPRMTRRMTPISRHHRVPSGLERTDGMRFHEFASSEEEVEDWVKEAPGNKARLTVTDTLRKENIIRKLGEQVDEEALEEEENAEDDEDEDDDEDADETEMEAGSANEGFSDDDFSDGGFQTDDEEGFAESDDDSDGDSDYEWWTAGKSTAATSGVSTIRSVDNFRPSVNRHRSDSLSSINKSEKESPKTKTRHRRTRSDAINVPTIPDLPDSTDFVCGTLDEDRPLEDAYISCIEKRKAAKHRATPQDIDPTFPTSDPELEDDDDEEDEVDDVPPVVEESDANPLFLGKIDHIHGADARGRRLATRKSPKGSSPHDRLRSPPLPGAIKRLRSPVAPAAPKRLRSPPPPAGGAKRLRSPPPPAGAKRIRSPALMVAGDKVAKAPRSPAPTSALFSRSPRRHRSPAPTSRPESPPPSLAGVPTVLLANRRGFTEPFLGQRHSLVHTASLPRTPNHFGRSRKVAAEGLARAPNATELEADADVDVNGDADGVRRDSGYRRGAIDIVQGLERKRLRRRQKYYEKHCRKEERKEKEKRDRKPQPGRGAQRMRQVGIECAIYRGKRVLSV